MVLYFAPQPYGYRGKKAESGGAKTVFSHNLYYSIVGCSSVVFVRSFRVEICAVYMFSEFWIGINFIADRAFQP